MTDVKTYPNPLKLFASMVYEGILLFGVVFFFSFVFYSALHITQPEHFRWQAQLFLFIVIGAYFLLCWIRRGQTVAMRSWNIILVRRDASKPHVGQLIARYCLSWVIPLIVAALIEYGAQQLGSHVFELLIFFAPFCNLIVCFFRRDHQMLHDLIAGTQLVNVKKTK